MGVVESEVTLFYHALQLPLSSPHFITTDFEKSKGSNFQDSTKKNLYQSILIHNTQ